MEKNMKLCNGEGYFKRNGYSLKQRQHLFYGLCIPLRIFIGMLVVYLFQVSNEDLHKAICSILIMVCVYTIFHTLSCLRASSGAVTKGNASSFAGAWWHRKFEMMVALCVLIMSSMVLHDPIQYPIAQYIAIPIFLDIMYGLVLSVIKKVY